MNVQSYMHLSRFFGFIAIVTAFYNAYLSWFKDDFSLFLLALTLLFSMFVVIIQKYVKVRKNKENNSGY